MARETQTHKPRGITGLKRRIEKYGANSEKLVQGKYKLYQTPMKKLLEWASSDLNTMRIATQRVRNERRKCRLEEVGNRFHW